MIIDCHGHVSAPAELWAYKATLLAHRGSHGRGGVRISDEELIAAAANKAEVWPASHLELMKRHGTDLQLISPRPFQMMQSEKPAKLVHWFTEEVNTLIARQCRLLPDKFVPIAGLPQAAGEPIEAVFGELERCVKLGFKGCLLNPDPYENSGVEAPGLGERYWYPLYEKLCELDIPAHIHSTGSRSERTPYSLHFINEESIAIYTLVNSKVLEDFPNLKILVSHGGGAIPYQLGRFESASLRTKERFSTRLRKLYFDTVLYTPAALRLLIETVGADQCLFGTECPGVGSAVNPQTGETMDHIAPYIESFEWLAAADKKKIFEDNARRLFRLDRP